MVKGGDIMNKKEYMIIATVLQKWNRVYKEDNNLDQDTYVDFLDHVRSDLGYWFKLNDPKFTEKFNHEWTGYCQGWDGYKLSDKDLDLE